MCKREFGALLVVARGVVFLAAAFLEAAFLAIDFAIQLVFTRFGKRVYQIKIVMAGRH